MSPGESAFEPASVTTKVIPEHELIRSIASGAYGQVWLARNALGILRAVKIVHRANFDHDRPFEREFAGIKSFEPISRSHEGLVNLLQVGRDDAAGYFYYVMELADDENAVRRPQNGDSALALQDPSTYLPRTLASELKRRGRLSLEECVRIGLSLARALAYLHQQDLVHRDIKPSNIIFVKGTAKLADVGLVAGVGETRSFVGTEGFVPPEGPGTRQADLYSLGIVLYVLSTGKSHQDFPEPLVDLASEPDHGRWLEFNAVLHKACEAKVHERYQTAEEMCEELELLERGQSVKEKRAGRRRRTAAKRVCLAAVLAVLLLPLLNAVRSHRPTAEAEKLYEFGKWHYNQLTSEDHAKALDYLTRAVTADPKFVKPYGEWTMLYCWIRLPGITNEQIRIQKVREIADRALALDPNAAEGHIALSWCKFLQRDWRGAEDEIQRAIRLNPDRSIAHDIYCSYLSMQGRTSEAHRESQRAEELSPPDAARVSAVVASWAHIADRRFDLAISQLQRALALDRNFEVGHAFLGDCYEWASNYLSAIEEFRIADKLGGEDPDRVDAKCSALRDAYNAGGQEGYLRKRLEFFRADEASGRGVAGCYARLGEREKALAEIEANFDKPQEWQQIKFFAMYDPLRDEPRFKALVKRAGLEP